MMVTSIVAIYPKFVTLSLILPIILTINHFLCRIQLFQDHIGFFLYVLYISGP